MFKQFFLIPLSILLTAFTISAQTPQATPPPNQPTTPPTQQQTEIQRQNNQTQQNQTQQNPAENPSTQPQVTQPTQPQQPGVTPSRQIPNQQTVIPPSPTQNVGTSGVAPAVLPDDPPPVASDFQAPIRPLPSADRVGVDLTNQMPLTLEEAIEMALQNNNDIDTSRNDVQIAEFNLKAANGIYDPNIISENYFESATTPTASTIGGATNGSVTAQRFFNSAGLSGFSPFAGGSYAADFSFSRLTTSNSNATLNPQFPSALTFSYVQPLLRDRRFDNNRRQIEIAKKNLSLTDSQFRQRAIEVIAQVEQSYWNLVFALRNLQVQIDAVRQARTQLESNQRLVAKGVLAPIDIVAANTQITTFEQSVYTAQEDVTRAENNLNPSIPRRNNDVLFSPATSNRTSRRPQPRTSSADRSQQSHLRIPESDRLDSFGKRCNR